jgi:hypothetical protein
VTGGEPFLLADIGNILAACTVTAPITVLTNGTLLAGRRLQTPRLLPRDRLTLQISLDSPTPERHDRHRGKGTWLLAWKGIERAREEDFRVRLAATVSTDHEAEEFRRFLDAPPRLLAARDQKSLLFDRDGKERGIRHRKRRVALLKFLPRFSRLLLMVEGRSAEALRAFAKALAEHGGDPSQIEAIAMTRSSPGRHWRSAAISSGSRLVANDLVPASTSIFALVCMCCC